MKFFKLLFFTCFLNLYAQTNCVGGFASGFPCNNIDLYKHFSLSDLSASSINDSWGWTDPATGIEYGLVGANNGTCFFNISDPLNPIYLGKLPTATTNSIWRDVKVYQNHAFIVSEASNHGMQVFDLSKLTSVVSAPVTFSQDAYLGTMGDCHNIAINEKTGYAYLVGCDSFSGGIHFVNIQDPTNPIDEGGYAQSGYSHDAQIINYEGPDCDYYGKEIYIGSHGNTDEVVIIDVSDKTNPTEIAAFSYPNVSYAHQGWFDKTQTYFLLGDETDEQSFGLKTRLIVFDFTDLDNPVLDFQHFGPTNAIDHNGYTRGDLFFQSNYARGIAILDISDIENDNLTEVAFFDTYTPHNNASFFGVWNVYPYFKSGTLLVSDYDTGVYFLKYNGFTTDDDSDGILSETDNCPYVSNADQSDIDSDGIGDLCDTDNDNDGVSNFCDNCEFIANVDQNDNDNDGIGDLCDDDDDNDGILDVSDNCPLTPNADQADSDSNGTGDACETILDDDNDTIPNSDDNCLTISNPNQEDNDDDGIGDLCDDDDDDDGILDINDNCPFISNTSQDDDNNNGIGNECDNSINVLDYLISPNPALNQTILYIPNNKTLLKIGLYNELGQQVFFKDQLSIENQYEIDLNSLQKGIYFVVINENTTLKLIVQ